MSIEALIKDFQEVAYHPNQQLANFKAAGKKVIGVLPYYAPEELVFAAGMVESNRMRLLGNGERIRPEGHIVVRVYEGGSEFQIFVLNDRNTEYDVIYKTDRITSNR